MLGEVRSQKRLFVCDQAIVAFSFGIAALLQIGWPATAAAALPILGFVLCAMVSAALLFPPAGMYRRHLGTASIPDVAISLAAVVMVIVAVAILSLVGLTGASVPVGVFIVAVFVAPPLLLGARLARRINDSFVGSLLGGGRSLAPTGTPILLVGTGTACDLFLRALRNEAGSAYRPVAIVDDVRDTNGLYFHDVPIIGSILDIDQIKDWFTTRELPGHLVLTEPPEHFDDPSIRGLIAWAEDEGVDVRRLPGLCETYGLDQPLATVELDLDDLLPRPCRSSDRQRLARLVAGRRIAVTGAGGSIGSELVRQVAANGPESLLLIDHSEFNLYSIGQELARLHPTVENRCEICDIRERTRVDDLFDSYQPEIVLHAAALKHVPIVEANPCEGVLTNVVGTRNVADAARRVGASAMVQISTDKAVNATSVMGATKRIAELYCGALDRASETGSTRFMTVRFGNVLGSSGSLIPLFKEQIANGGPLTVTDPRMERFFMTIREAVELTLMASAHGIERKTDRGAIFVLDMGEPVKIIDLAERMIRLSGLEPGRDIGIEIIGSRPGEKLFEELFDTLETRAPSGLSGVLSATSADVPLDRLVLWANRLEAFARLNDAPMVLDTLHDVVPGYREAAQEAANESWNPPVKLEPKSRVREEPAATGLKARWTKNSGATAAGRGADSVIILPGT
ncbi:polysaccharide biosynthesis protein [Jannaschia ovalis]|uniref:Nucleoside-diphosphate sugar epimerase/dehydratase n=1 Tax=Jannaschia ovalis TaxID=3038773 RepID=A0ABY8LBP9_9RHOB|nr:nucleoside-diphosphate sugar epimerase/dehydratase [Jannaschia sp. GRR-S6-38]WGH78711.1 nucleoside-diphosphate sugar epimerase/dehydratase [Jannaschia sp. GRR-S6-38]